MHRLPEALLDAAQVLREAFAGEVGKPCQLSITQGDGTTLSVLADGAVLAVYAAGGSEILRQGPVGAEFRTALAG